MLSEADITPASLSKLSAGFQKLGTTVTQISEVGDVVKSTSDFSNKTKEATIALGSIKDAANVASQSLAGFHGASDSTKEFHVQMNSITLNYPHLHFLPAQQLG